MTLITLSTLTRIPNNASASKEQIHTHIMFRKIEVSIKMSPRKKNYKKNKQQIDKKITQD